MRALCLLLPVLLAGCAASDVAAPSLAHRAAESIDPRAPVAELGASTQPSAGLVEQLQALVAQARAGDAAFRPTAEAAERLVAAAGAPQSESWVVAQQALSAAIAARAPVTRAVGEIDSLGARRIQTVGGIGAGDLAALTAAAEQVAEIDRVQASTIDRMQARLAR